MGDIFLRKPIALLFEMKMKKMKILENLRKRVLWHADPRQQR